MDKRIIDLLSKCDFDKLCEDNYWDKIGRVLNSFCPNEYTLYSGASKCAIKFSFYDKIIKIPYFFWSEETFFDGVAEGNYLAEEVRLYSLAKESGVENIFAEVSYVATINGHPIYEQDYCECYDEVDWETMSSRHSDESYKFVESDGSQFDSPFGGSGMDWLACVVDAYGEGAYYALLGFMERNHIADMHDANYGYYNGKPVIIDYATFNF